MLAVANLLGECRFGYHAALSAWPGNEAARSGLDQALLLVIENEPRAAASARPRPSCATSPKSRPTSSPASRLPERRARRRTNDFG